MSRRRGEWRHLAKPRLSNLSRLTRSSTRYESAVDKWTRSTIRADSWQRRKRLTKFSRLRNAKFALFEGVWPAILFKLLRVHRSRISYVSSTDRRSPRNNATLNNMYLDIKRWVCVVFLLQKTRISDFRNSIEVACFDTHFSLSLSFFTLCVFKII